MDIAKLFLGILIGSTALWLLFELFAFIGDSYLEVTDGILGTGAYVVMFQTIGYTVGIICLIYTIYQFLLTIIKMQISQNSLFY
jgi:hypothetical protein